MNLKLSDNDYNEVMTVSKIIKEVKYENYSELYHELKEIEAFQPFLISLLLGYRERLQEHELEELAKDLIIIWRYFADRPDVKQTRITAGIYTEVDKKNIELINYGTTGTK